jgi:hypothetical protein
VSNKRKSFELYSVCIHPYLLLFYDLLSDTNTRQDSVTLTHVRNGKQWSEMWKKQRPIGATMTMAPSAFHLFVPGVLLAMRDYGPGA